MIKIKEAQRYFQMLFICILALGIFVAGNLFYRGEGKNATEQIIFFEESKIVDNINRSIEHKEYTLKSDEDESENLY